MAEQKIIKYTGMKAISVWLLLCLIGGFFVSTAHALPDQIPIKDVHYKHLPSTETILNFLQSIEQSSPLIKIIALGKTASNRKISLVLVSKDQTFLNHRISDPKKITVFLVGNIHGDEPAGGEALQQFILNLAKHQDSHLLNSFNFVILVNANPDGRDRYSRYNDMQLDINKDFVIASANETKLIIQTLNHYNPQIVVDFHEYNVDKKILGDKEGYRYIAQTQYAIGNNENIDKQIRNFSNTVLLPEIIRETRSHGMNARHYVGPILSIKDGVTNASLSIEKLRNYSGLAGRFTFLVEIRKYSKHNKYETPLNIKQRIENSYVSLQSILAVLAKNKVTIHSIYSNVSNTNKHHSGKRAKLYSSYQLNTLNPLLSLKFLNIATKKLITIALPNQTFINTQQSSLTPIAYTTHSHQKELLKLLDAHFIKYDSVTKDREVTKLMVLVKNIKHIKLYSRQPSLRFTFRKIIKPRGSLKTGMVLIKTDQVNGILIPLLLEPASQECVFQYSPYNTHVESGKILPIDSIAYP